MPANLRSSVTPLDGNTFHKEFPAWITPPARQIISNNMRSDIKQASPPRRNVYYETLKPIFIVLTLAGVLPVFKVNFGSHKFQVLLVGGACLAMYLIFAYFSSIVTLLLIHHIFHDDDFSSIIIQVASMMLLMQHVFYLVLSWPESLAVHKYLIEWKHFQAQYEYVSKSVLTLSCKRKIILLSLLYFIISGGFMLGNSLFNPSSVFNNITYIVLAYHQFIQTCFYILWFSNSWAVTEAADQYNDSLSQECMLDITPEKLEEYRLLWMRLTEIVRSGSSMLSYTMGVMVATPFAYQVIAAYNLTIFVIRSIQFGRYYELEDAIATFTMFVFYCILLYMFCNCGHNMTVKCEKVQDILFAFKPRSDTNFSKVNRELRLFLRCLRSVPPCATLRGYVTVNRKVFLHLSGVLITYVIILVQFNIGSINNARPAPVNVGKQTINQTINQTSHTQIVIN